MNGGFDLSAAVVRQSESDSRAFMEAFAARMEQAYPQRVTAERKRDGVFAKTRHVARIAIDTGSHVYTLERDGGRLKAGRAQTVRGVCLKSEEMPVPAWLSALSGELQALAEHVEAGHAVLHDFLMS